MPIKFTPKSKKKILREVPAKKANPNIQEAVALHQKGDLTRAKIIYEEILKIQPKV